LIYPIAAFLSVILATWLIAHFFSAFLGRLLRRTTPLVSAHVRRLAWIFIWLFGIILAVQQLGINTELLLLLIGIFGAGLVVANKDTLQNIASKYFSDVYIPFKVGDTIRVHDYSGKVIEVNPISTVLVTDNEELISIPNSFFLRDIVVNTTPSAWQEVTIPIVIGSDVDLVEFESEILKSCNKLKLHLDERFPPILTVKNREERSTQLLLTLMVKEPSRKDLIVSETNAKIAETIEKTKRKKG
jgi:small conductance mechanosensitive channel